MTGSPVALLPPLRSMGMKRKMRAPIPIHSLLRVFAGLLLCAPVALGATPPSSSAACVTAVHGRLCVAVKLPANWALDRAQAKRLEIAAIFHRQGDNQARQPVITIDAAPHYPWLDPYKEIGANIASIRKQHPGARILPLVLSHRVHAWAVTVSYPGFWQILSFRDFGKVIALAELQCGSAAQCAGLRKPFLALLAGLHYIPPAPGAAAPKFNGGFVYGSDWILLFSHMPWLNDTDLANRFNVAEMYYPADWDPRILSPYISVGYRLSKKGRSVRTVMSADIAEAREHQSNVVIHHAPAIVWSKGRAEVRTFTSSDGWDEVAYSERGPAIFITSLHCQSKRQCRQFRAILNNFVPSLNLRKNFHVVIEHATK